MCALLWYIIKCLAIQKEIKFILFEVDFMFTAIWMSYFDSR